MVEEDPPKDGTPDSKCQSLCDRPMSYSPNIRGKAAKLSHPVEPITKSIGTTVYSSPEQLSANALVFDQRSDIWSLGIVLLELFYTINTVMEQLKVFAKAREGQLPEKLLQSNPSLGRILLRMLHSEPGNRPDLTEIRETLLEGNSLGYFESRYENSKKWKKRLFKIRDKILYCFGENESKAENLYNLTECTLIQETEPASNSPVLRLNHRIQIACLIKGSDAELKKLGQVLTPYCCKV
jgi:serine/threonine protein kinase